jgi:hypothetical protein
MITPITPLSHLVEADKRADDSLKDSVSDLPTPRQALRYLLKPPAMTLA